MGERRHEMVLNPSRQKSILSSPINWLDWIGSDACWQWLLTHNSGAWLHQLGQKANPRWFRPERRSAVQCSRAPHLPLFLTSEAGCCCIRRCFPQVLYFRHRPTYYLTYLPTYLPLPCLPPSSFLPSSRVPLFPSICCHSRLSRPTSSLLHPCEAALALPRRPPASVLLGDLRHSSPRVGLSGTRNTTFAAAASARIPPHRTFCSRGRKKKKKKKKETKPFLVPPQSAALRGEPILVNCKEAVRIKPRICTAFQGCVSLSSLAGPASQSKSSPRPSPGAKSSLIITSTLRIDLAAAVEVAAWHFSSLRIPAYLTLTCLVESVAERCVAAVPCLSPTSSSISLRMSTPSLRPEYADWFNPIPRAPY